jgi:diguanylate cyclase (GGDEF)-like protein/PAS domain S-box-containing protein
MLGRLARFDRWPAILALGVAAAFAYVVIPHSAATELVLYDGVVAVALIVSVIGCRRWPRPDRLPWVCVSLSLAGFLCGQLLWWTYERAGEHPSPSLADGFSLAGYLPLAAAAFALARSREEESDRAAWLDAGILVAVAGLLIWDGLVQPNIDDPDVTLPTLAVTLAYPIADLLVLGLVIRLLFMRTARDMAATTFIAGVTLKLTADLAFAWEDLTGTFVSGSWVGATWLVGYLLLGFAALRPWAQAPVDETEPDGAGRGRLALVLAAVVIPPLVFLGDLSRRQLLTVDTAAVAALVTMLVMALVAARLWTLLRLTRRLEGRRGEQRLAALISHLVDAILVVGADARIAFSSPAAAKLLDMNASELSGRSLPDFFTEDSRRGVTRVLHRLPNLAAGATVSLDGRVYTGAGDVRVVEGTACNLLSDNGVDGIVVTLRDVTERAKLEQQLKRRAFHDDLTGLANRALFTDRLAHALAAAGRDPGQQVAVLFVDIDDFKTVNDGMGHSAGDELLRAVGERMRASLRPGDTVARLGGDEFAVLLERVPSASYAIQVAERMLELLMLPVDVAGLSLAVPASVGVTLAGPGSTVESLLQDADIAMYTAKSRGKAGVALFDETLRGVAARRLALRVELPHALRSGQFRLAYQPIINTSVGRIAGFEALIRWHHPRRGILDPAEFIPAAEESGAIVEIGCWVLEQACRQAALWNAQSLNPLNMSVNVSAAQLQNPGFSDVVSTVLDATGLPPALLTIELTESVLVEHAQITPVLAELRELGVGIAIDDFGTGYSSLAYLQKFPVTSLKVDRAFVAELSARGNSGLVRSILSLAEALGLSTVAEGVETIDQLEILGDLRCHFVQGFYLGTPQTVDEVEALLDESAAPGSQSAWSAPQTRSVSRR